MEEQDVFILQHDDPAYYALWAPHHHLYFAVYDTFIDIDILDRRNLCHLHHLPDL